MKLAMMLLHRTLLLSLIVLIAALSFSTAFSVRSFYWNHERINPLGGHRFFRSLPSTTLIPSVKTAVLRMSSNPEEDFFFGNKSQTRRSDLTSNISNQTNASPSNNNNTTKFNATKLSISNKPSLAPINLLQGVVAGFCILGKLPVLNSPVEFALGKLSFAIGLGIMGLALKEMGALSVSEANKKEDYVTTGLFSIVRHPLHSGQLLALHGLAHMGSSVMRFFLLGVYYLVVKRKISLVESRLEKQYGTDYELYKVLVKGKLVPYQWSQKLLSTEKKTKT